MKTAIITGITGQDGAYLAKVLLDNGYKVIGILRSYNNANVDKLKYLKIERKVILEECDLSDIPSIIKILTKYKPAELYNLAAQSSVGLSFEQPIGTIQFNTLSVLNLLESIRLVDKDIRFYQASSSEMYGKVLHLPVTEYTPMHPLSPYAISKASAYWTVVNYRESYGLFSCNGVLFNHESYLRSNNFFVKKVIRESLLIKSGIQDELRVGNIDIKRDFGYAPEYVKAMWLMLQHSSAEDFIICSGESVSLREIILYVFEKLEIDQQKLVIDKELYRPTDIEDIYGYNQKAKKLLKWNYTLNFFEVLDLLLAEEAQAINKGL
ncbi:GDP-mannose 4,6-dehydratase [Rhodocytophaga aerolata]|uniref:GDP-mannose 4,6-dehydratase n=1 Tax=Rhodocytophaga aerolata TaxID=455078 RepID=A0ABT8RGA3_9BACT|nr:GDP-mannose 4,6-dehydratase [Rhodocytophaga aerolata]MDO1449742.1 GDP-mannose 4,6-dehydratase [Rhodocytophaga aerolata]